MEDFIFCTPPTQTEFGSKITTDAFYRRLTPAERRRLGGGLTHG